MIAKQVNIQTQPIRLGQFLKLADMVQDGLHGKTAIQNMEVFVNDMVETRRGKQLCHGDIVHYGDSTCQVLYRSNS